MSASTRFTSHSARYTAGMPSSCMMCASLSVSTVRSLPPCTAEDEVLIQLITGNAYIPNRYKQIDTIKSSALTSSTHRQRLSTRKTQRTAERASPARHNKTQRAAERARPRHQVHKERSLRYNNSQYPSLSRQFYFHSARYTWSIYSLSMIYIYMFFILFRI